jgi:hypothetical protein
MAAKDMHATREELLEAVFSVRSVSRLYNEGKLSLRETAEEVGVKWPPVCEDVSLGAEDRPLLEDITKQSSEDRD